MGKCSGKTFTATIPRRAWSSGSLVVLVAKEQLKIYRFAVWQTFLNPAIYTFSISSSVSLPHNWMRRAGFILIGTNSGIIQNQDIGNILLLDSVLLGINLS